MASVLVDKLHRLERAGSSAPLTVLIRCASGRSPEVAAALESLAFELVYVGVRTIAARATGKMLPQLSSLAFLEDVEPARVLFPAVDVGCRAIGIQEMVAAGRSGKGVALAVIDTGVDPKHRDFQSSTGESALEALIWVPADAPTMPGKAITFGRKAIDTALAKGEELPGDLNGHGTHCTSIAAGTGASSAGRFAGVATGSDLFAVGMASLDNASVLVGIQEVLQLVGDRPAVFSLSLATHYGSHDGNDPLEVEIDALSGPGRIFVVAAGNDADKQIHWRGELREALCIPFELTDPTAQGLVVYVAGTAAVEATLVLPTGETIEASNSDPLETDCGTVSVTMSGHLPQDAMQIFVAIYNAEEESSWELRLSAASGGARSVHAWGIATSPHRQKRIFTVPEISHTVAIPGTARRAITVGSFVSKTTFESEDGAHDDPDIGAGEPSLFSGRGPTRDGRDKPDLLAPGQYVTAALSSTCDFAKNKEEYKCIRHPTEGYVTMDGTSMATPFVAGAIALALEDEPSLTPEEIKARIQRAAAAEGVPPAEWHLDVAALLSA
jgi:subtilisin family serine protease